MRPSLGPTSLCSEENGRVIRTRRNRKSAAIRKLLEETLLTPADLVIPFFLLEGRGRKEEIPSLPGVFRLSIEGVVREAERYHKAGIQAALLFPVIERDKKDPIGSEALNENGLLVRAIAALKASLPSMCLIADVALDPFTSHGHDGVLDLQGNILNDETVDRLCKMAVILGQAGADIVAPSDMMDGRIQAIRSLLDQSHMSEVGILSYCAKYASSLYTPFRDAIGSHLQSGDKKSYQLNPANSREAVRKALVDAEEGADMLMIKPALPYLDIISKIRAATQLPIWAYQVSGEYTMAMAASKWLDSVQILYESLLSIKRAGADCIVSYAVPQVLEKLQFIH